MSIPNDALRKLVQEIESQAVAAQQQIGLVRTQLASKQRETRLAELTRSEMATLPPGAAVYEGVGKIFVAVPVAAIQAKLAARKKDLQAEAEALRSRLHYLETTARNSQDHIDTLLKGGATG